MSDFPNSPSVGDEYVLGGGLAGQTYRWDGTKWLLVAKESQAPPGWRHWTTYESAVSVPSFTLSLTSIKADGATALRWRGSGGAIGTPGQFMLRVNGRASDYFQHLRRIAVDGTIKFSTNTSTASYVAVGYLGGSIIQSWEGTINRINSQNWTATTQAWHRADLADDSFYQNASGACTPAGEPETLEFSVLQAGGEFRGGTRWEFEAYYPS